MACALRTHDHCMTPVRQFGGHATVTMPAYQSPPARERSLPSRRKNVLFLCTGNSARSILAEALLNRSGGRRFRAYSAGSHPKGAVHPAALALLKNLGFATRPLRSKSWDVFAAEGAVEMDIVITVCDSAAEEVCPVWPGAPVTAHWGIPDPAAVQGVSEDVAAAFLHTFHALRERVSALTSLSATELDGPHLAERLRAVHATAAGTA